MRWAERDGRRSRLGDVTAVPGGLSGPTFAASPTANVRAAGATGAGGSPLYRTPDGPNDHPPGIRPMVMAPEELA